MCSSVACFFPVVVILHMLFRAYRTIVLQRVEVKEVRERSYKHGSFHGCCCMLGGATTQFLSRTFIVCRSPRISNALIHYTQKSHIGQTKRAIQIRFWFDIIFFLDSRAFVEDSG